MSFVICNISCFGRGVFGPELLLKSQLVIVRIQFSRLEQSANFGKALPLSCLRCCILLLLLFGIEFCVVPSEFFELYQEVS
jgi:hypothetical protein